MENNIEKVFVVDDSRTTLMLIENLLLEIDKNIQVKSFDRANLALNILKLINQICSLWIY